MARDTPTLRDAEEAYEAGDIETALAICDGLIGDDETKAPVEVLYLAGECLLELQEAEEALHLFDLALVQDADNPLLIHCRGLCQFELGAFDRAQALFERASGAAPELAEPVFYLGLVAERTGDLDGANERFAAAARKDPENFVVPAEWSEDDIKAAYDVIIEETPDPLGTWFAGLTVEVEDLPPDASLSRGGSTISPLVHCLFEGEPGEGPDGPEPASWLVTEPSRVVLFRRNLGKSAHDEYELQREVFEAVLWELMEFLGLEDQHLEALGVMEADLEADDDDLHPSRA